MNDYMLDFVSIFSGVKKLEFEVTYCNKIRYSTFGEME